MIRDNVDVSGSQKEPESIVVEPEAHYNIGTSQNLSVHIPTFLQRSNGDPAVKVRRLVAFFLLSLTPLVQNFLSKLTDHLLPRIQAKLQQETDSLDGPPCVSSALDPSSPIIQDTTSRNFVFFKSDCIYRHKLLRFNFTTYDVRRGTDVIKPGTTRCNIMLLADLTDSSSHLFLYARVLGAYHANVIYTGPGMQDYKARRFDFLWVRWYEVVDPGSSGWSKSALDSIRFPPLHDCDSFGFVDPIDVLRGCHVLPAFSKGQRNKAGIDVSRCAKDSKDYELYYVGRYVQQCYDDSVVDSCLTPQIF
jgi:hypothetical protein